MMRYVNEYQGAGGGVPGGECVCGGACVFRYVNEYQGVRGGAVVKSCM